MTRRSGPGRGTRASQRGIFSGTTITCIPSGVTLDRRGMSTVAGNFVTFNAGVVAWAGTTLEITHGFSTLYYFHASLLGTGSGVTNHAIPVIKEDVTANTGVSICFRTGTGAIDAGGGTVQWFCAGTV